MRAKKEKIDLAYNVTRDFFDERAQKYNSENPYGATMYQDHDRELVERRNEAEIKRILPQLKIDTDSMVLDVACGVGRWADALLGLGIKKYIGTDFSNGLINIARSRIQMQNYDFVVASAQDIKEKLRECVGGGSRFCFNRVILSGLLLYLNDEDVIKLFDDICGMCIGHTKIYIRVPVGIEERLTLKDYFSNELEAEYNAIYRTRDEYYEFMNDSLLKNGYRIETEGYIFEDGSLNNRQETRQYFFILSNQSYCQMYNENNERR